MRGIRFAREGWFFIMPAAILTAAALLIQWYIAAIVLGLATLFLFNFFRDPHRAGSERRVDVLSPADGTVVQIKDIGDAAVWPGLTKQVSILMSVFDVHVNRAPMTGRIVHYRYNPGGRGAMFSDKSAGTSEQNLIVIDDGNGGCVAFKQIAGLLARRIVFDKKEGEEVVRGERVGMIKFGSRVDVFLQTTAAVRVQMRDKVRVGLSVIAEIAEQA